MIPILCVTGLLLGSFLNAWIWRTREGRSVLQGRSMCPSCQKQLMWYDNIPLLSFLVLKGRCRSCAGRISWQYPLVEVAVAGLFALAAWIHGDAIVLIVRDCFILFFLCFTFVYDVQYQEIWDRMTTWPAIVLVCATAIFAWQSWQSIVFGIAFGGGFFLLQYVLSKGRWIGGGDIRLGMFMGVILGWPLILVALFLAYVGGALFVTPFLILKKKRMASKVPFGAYLSIATIVAMFWGEKLIEWYMGMVL